MDESNKINLKIAVIGVGGWGRHWVRNLSEKGALAAICDPHDDCQHYSDQYGVPALPFDEILKDQAVSGVVLTSPSILHFNQAKEALLAGKDVFVEKPLALSVSDSASLAELAKAQNRVLMVGHLLHYHAAFQKLGEMVKRGMIGQPRLIHARRLNCGPLRTQDNALWDLATHDVSMILALGLETPEIVSAIPLQTLPSLNLDFDNAFMPPVAEAVFTLRFKNGCMAQTHVSWLSPVKEHKFTVTGETGSLIFDDTRPWDEKLCLARHTIVPAGHNYAVALEREFIALCPSEPLGNECDHFLQCITKRQTPRTDGFEALRVARVIEDAQNFIQKAGS